MTIITSKETTKSPKPNCNNSNSKSRNTFCMRKSRLLYSNKFTPSFFYCHLFLLPNFAPPLLIPIPQPLQLPKEQILEQETRTKHSNSIHRKYTVHHYSTIAQTTFNQRPYLSYTTRLTEPPFSSNKQYQLVVGPGSIFRLIFYTRVIETSGTRVI